LRVLIAYERSGIVRDAFATKGHDAWSCDLFDTDRPGKHIQGDAMVAILSDRWDFIGLHTPCTAVCVSGNKTYASGKEKYSERLKAIKYIQLVWKGAVDFCNKVYLENPVGVLTTMAHLPKPQYIQPWQFGHGEKKKTGLWLHGLSQLKPTNIVNGREERIFKMPPTPKRSKLRSETYQGIANAMAEQWG